MSSGVGFVFERRDEQKQRVIHPKKMPNPACLSDRRHGSFHLIKSPQTMNKILCLLLTLAAAASTYAQSFTATLSGAAERPTPNTSTGTGIGTLTLSGATVTYDLTYSGLSAAPTAAHVHGPANSSAAAGVMFAITANGTLGTSGRYTGTQAVTASQAADIVNGLTYFNIHTALNAGGEIRGQITAVPEPSTYALIALGGATALGLRRRKA